MQLGIRLITATLTALACLSGAETDAVVFQRALDACLDGRGYTVR